MPEEKITYEQVKEGVEELRKCANTMEEIFTNVTGQMRNMTSDGTFQGVASNTLSGEFEQFKGTFPSYVEKVREFADAYEAAGNVLKANEDDLARRADRMADIH